MRKRNKISDYTSITKNDSYEADSLEVKLQKVLQNNEPIDSSAPTIYTNRSDGVLAGYNIRTDRFDVAIDAMDKVSKSYISKRDAFHNKKAEKGGGETPANTSDTQLKIV